VRPPLLPTARRVLILASLVRFVESLGDEERVPSLRITLLAPLAEAGAGWPLPSSLASLARTVVQLARRQSVSARGPAALSPHESMNVGEIRRYETHSWRCAEKRIV
jgi:hypothetical protein